MHPPGNYTTVHAESICGKLKWCGGFTFQADANTSDAPVSVFVIASC